MRKITLNAEKRNSIANVIETHFRNANSKARVNWLLAKNAFNDHKEKIHSLANNQFTRALEFAFLK